MLQRFLPLSYLLLSALIGFSTLGVQAHGQSPNTEGRPNVVIVITDDQGYGDLACHGNPRIKTPELDALHAESVRLTDYHVAPTCSPTRCAFLTGHWTNRTGVWHTIMGRSMLRENEITMGNVFSDAGYETGMFGKWHLGDNYPYRPEDRGFSEVMRHGGGGVGQTPDHWDNAYFDGSYWHNSKVTPVKGFCTDVFFDYAENFIRDSAKANKPFLAYIATNAPHGPMHCPEKYSAPYKDLSTKLANFYGMIANIDENVGQLSDLLDELEIADNTIFIYTTDNGSSSGSKLFNAGMRGAKGSHYDGGHRVPLFLRWPNANLGGGSGDSSEDANGGGRDVDTITSYVDVLPTLISMCRVEPPKDVVFDGVDISPLLFGKSEGWQDRFLVTDSQRVKDPIKWKSSAVMSDKWRLCNGKELFEIEADPGQENDVADENPDVVKRMREFYESWWAELEPTFSQSTAIYLGHEADNPARLTSHDWITTRMTPWNQSQVRAAMNGDANTGFWNVKVTKAGRYQIRLRRWPSEIDQPLSAALPPGEPVPGERAFRETPGKSFTPVKASLKIGETSQSKAVEAGAKEVLFEMDLDPQTTRMTAAFETASGEVFGSYFAYVELMND